jgi:predicted TIM-barrel fold metal-dependent hydrolase
MRDGFRIFDAHTHIGTARHSGRRFTADQMVAHMDRQGIDRSLIIPFPVVEDFRAEHDEIAEGVRRYPDRLVGAACIPPFIPEAEFRAEVRRCARDLGLRALKFQPQFQALNPISPKSEFLFEAALEHGLTVVAHTGNGVPYALPSLFIVPARQFPDLRIVLGHCGGSLLYHEAIVAALVCPNVYLELSTLMPHNVREVLAHVPPERLMIGSDVPDSTETEIRKIQGLEIPEADRRAILWDTAVALF